MKTYLVNIPWIEHNDKTIYLAGEIQAESWPAAQEACDAMGVELLWELDETVSCSEEFEAMIERMDHSLH